VKWLLAWMLMLIGPLLFVFSCLMVILFKLLWDLPQ
jgi:hypothetical protein